jgi:hypothetical protein
LARGDDPPHGPAEGAGDGTDERSPGFPAAERGAARYFGGNDPRTGRPLFFQSPLSRVTGYGYAPEDHTPAPPRKRRRKRKSRPVVVEHPVMDNPWWAR